MNKLICFFVVALAARAQVGSGILSGTVTDPSAGAVPAVSVKATQAATGLERSTITDSRGVYVFDPIPAGVYTITAQKAGFRGYEASSVAIELNQSARHDIRLTLGGAQERVTVSAITSPLDTDSAAVGYRMDQSKIEGLPLAQRTVVSLVTLGPGAIPRQLGGFGHDVNNDVQEGSRGSVALNPPINGARSTQNTFLLDGAYDTSRNTFAIAVYPPMDSVSEFHIQSSLAPAEFPQSGGGAIDVVTKSGGRNFHGSAFEYFRNEATDARNYFDDPSLPRPIFRQNQFGASLGGPVARRKDTFFYGIYEGTRQKSGTS